MPVTTGGALLIETYPTLPAQTETVTDGFPTDPTVELDKLFSFARIHPQLPPYDVWKHAPLLTVSAVAVRAMVTGISAIGFTPSLLT